MHAMHAVLGCWALRIVAISPCLFRQWFLHDTYMDRQTDRLMPTLGARLASMASACHQAGRHDAQAAEQGQQQADESGSARVIKGKQAAPFLAPAIA